MQSKASTVQEYIASLPEDRAKAVEALREIISKHIPTGFKEEMNYGMIGFVVPHSIYPAGYHCDPKMPLPFMNVASQKNFIAVYHMGIYANPELYNWFVDAHAKASTKKLDMGKSCMRYKKPEDIPYQLIGELAEKITTKQWIDLYESAFRKKG